MNEKRPYIEASNTDTLWDIVVIGGGPAGMMAAATAAEKGAKVLLVEKNESLGKKLLITGGGRCNVTNAEFDTRKFLDTFKDTNKYLFSAFSQWSVTETLEFFHGKKMDTKIEALKRVFPVSNSAQSVWDVLVAYMNQGNVQIRSQTAVTGFEYEGDTLVAAKLKSKELIRGRQFILATGGTSRPETGSTGDGFTWLSKIGHTVIEPRASLVPIAIGNPWIKRLQGITIADAKITSMQNAVKQDTARGRILFTHFGLSGPTILNMSKDIGELLKYGEVTLMLDLFPDLAYDTLNMKLQEVFKLESNKKIKNSLCELLPTACVPIVLEQAGIDGETWSHSVTREHRLLLVQLLKAIPLAVTGLLGEDKAIVSSGGVSLDEVDFKTMRSRKFRNLFLVGDILNIDRPSGGYSLQLCWTTGVVAGRAAHAILHI